MCDVAHRRVAHTGMIMDIMHTERSDIKAKMPTMEAYH
jgi:hypothetical protein